MASKSKKKTPTSSCVRYESHQQSEGTATLQNAEIVQVILLTSFTSWPSDGVLTNTARSGDEGGKVGLRTAQGTSLWGLGTVLERLSAGEASGGANDTEGFGDSGAS